MTGTLGRMGLPGIAKRLTTSPVVAALPIIVLLSVGCGNPFTQFYTGKTVSELRNTTSEMESPLGAPQVIYVAGSSYDSTLKQWSEGGYSVLGYASWIGGNPGTEREAAEQAKRVGASIVIWTWEYRGSSTGALPLTSPTVSTTYGYGTVYTGGSTAVWTGTATTYGTQTTYVPITTHTFMVRSAFLGKPTGSQLAPGGSNITVAVRTMTASESRWAGTSTGVIVDSVTVGSAAAASGIRAGDVILKVGFIPTYDVQQFLLGVGETHGKPVEVQWQSRLGQRSGTVRKVIDFWR